MRILVVDDEVALAENIAEVLMLYGHHAEVVASAEEALARLKNDRDGVQVLLTDYRLPGATGAELIGALRGLGSRIPALVITGHHDQKIVALAMRAGAADVLSKPVDIPWLLSWVEAAARPV